MKLAMVSRPLAEADLRLARQMGMTDVVTTVPGVTMAPEREQGPPLRYEDLLALRQRVEAQGLRLSVIEGYQLSDRITLGMPGRDEDLDRVCESIRNMGRAGIPVYCYNFMAVFNWLRTSNDVVGRGGALVTQFNAATSPPGADLAAACCHCARVAGLNSGVVGLLMRRPVIRVGGEVWCGGLAGLPVLARTAQATRLLAEPHELCIIINSKPTLI